MLRRMIAWMRAGLGVLVAVGSCSHVLVCLCVGAQKEKRQTIAEGAGELIHID